MLSIKSAFSALALAALAAAQPAPDPLAFPKPSREARPWSYWHWMGSAVDAPNLTRELEDFRKAGWGGLHIIPVYGAKGFKSRYLPYLSPQWMAMLRHTVTEANRLGLGIDMTTGTGWCFGGSQIPPEEASSLLDVQQYDAADLPATLSPAPLAVIAIPTAGPAVDLTARLSPPPAGSRVYVLRLRPAIKVKRAAPGAEGWMLNPFYRPAMTSFLAPFTDAFATYTGPKPRAQYHDSFEYRADWSPNLLAEFERRRGYRLQDEFRAFFDGQPADRAARVKDDYRTTMSELLLEDMTRPWVEWSHKQGFITRNEAHGSPGNLLDLYAAADIPETEMFNRDRSSLVSRFASSAAHTNGKRLVSSETGTWLAEHFTERLSAVKDVVEQLWLSGVNHILYHGSTYSPADAPWPGWVFYASTQMNSRNPIWRDVPTFSAYVTRAQSMLQEGKSDNDVLLYWPIHDVWHDPKGMTMNMTVHYREWVEGRDFGRLADRLIARGYRVDFISDAQLAAAQSANRAITVPGGSYRALVIPSTAHMPVETLERIVAFSRSGVPVILEALPTSVPGLANLEQRQARLAALNADLKQAFVGDPEAGLTQAGVRRETLTDTPGLEFLRRASPSAVTYFLANRGKQPIDQWIPLAAPATAAVLLDAMTGEAGVAARRPGTNQSEVYLQLEPGQTVFVRCLTAAPANAKRWRYRRGSPDSTPIAGSWSVRFTEGGPSLPAPYQTAQLASWTQSSPEAERFAGGAVYTIRFPAPTAPSPAGWFLDLGSVAESARVRLNGRDIGTLIAPPFRVYIGALAPSNTLEVEVTNLAANRIRYMDRNHLPWRVFHDINFVNLDYKPFDASAWPVRDSGLLGPVSLRPAQDFNPAAPAAPRN